MPISMKRYANSTRPHKLARKASKMYPDVNWVVELPSIEIEETYGKGVVISGHKGNSSSTYFILDEDPRINNWIHMMASQLEEENGTS